MRRVFPLFFLTACGFADPRGLIAISQIDPVRDDPGGFAFAVDVSDHLRLDPKAAQMNLIVVSDDKTVRKEVLHLRADPHAGPSPGAQVYTLTSADAAKLRQVQAQAAASRDEGGHGSVSIGVGIKACVVAGARANEALGSIWMRTKPDAGFAPLFVNIPISAIPDWKDMIDDFETCP